MKKFTVIMLAGIMSAALLTGCSSSKKKEQKPAEASTEKAVEAAKVDYSQGLNEDGTLAGINAADYVTVCQYKDLEIPEDKVSVSKEEVQQQIDSLLASHVTENQVTDREVKQGDTPQQLQRRVMEEAEWKLLPEAIRLIGQGRVHVKDRIAWIDPA